MVKSRNRYTNNTKKVRLDNNKANQSRSDEQELKNVVQIEGLQEQIQLANDSNMLVLPAVKRKDKIKEKIVERITKKKLTKKQRKHFEKVVDKKEKNLRRDELLESLAKVQVKQDELKLYTSVKDIGKKEKRKLNETEHLGATHANVDDVEENNNQKINTISGSNKKRRNDEDEKGLESADDTDDYSTDDEINNEELDAAMQAAREKQQKETLAKSIAKIQLDKKQAEENIKEEERKANLVGIDRKSCYIHVERSEEIKEMRSKLPIITEEQLIMDNIFNNQIVIICGETGSGKTTQTPQFLYEAGFANDNQIIGVTEPRRVAAISMSKRVAYEMSLPDDVVSYQIRYEANVSPKTKIKFMTDGVLLKEIQHDFLLSRYSSIIIDEAHERSVYTDILIGLLSRIVPLRHKKGSPLKLIIMSATLRVTDFTENTRLFKQPPPVVNVESRQYPVTIHFNKHTYQDYLAEAYRKACKIHRKLPEGGILIFVTGQQEVQVLCKKLRNTFPMKKYDQSNNTKVEVNKKKTKKSADNKIKLDSVPKVNLDNYSTIPLDEESELFQDDENEINDDEFNMENDDDDDDIDDLDIGSDDELKTVKSANEQPLYVLPLYSLLSSEQQIKVFEKPPEGSRLCVIATNVAETSLTIPNIKYVIDSGKIKMKFYDKITGVSTFKICWTSKASADQRAGRAGRTAPGHCYRIYSSAVYNDDFKQFSEPEILRKPVEDLVLQMKDLGIDRLTNFPFPTPPDDTAVKISENLLVQLGALDVDKTRPKFNKDGQITKITSLGKTMACFPINPRYSKMLTLANQHNLLQYVITLISALSVQELFIDGDTVLKQNVKNDDNEQSNSIKVKFAHLRQAWAGIGESLQLGDLMVLLVALGAVEYENDDGYKFCEQNGIRFKAVSEARKLRKQLTDTVNAIFPKINLIIDPKMQPPTQEDARLLRQIVLSGMVDRIARKYDHVVTDKDGKELRHAYQNLLLAEPVFIHPSSVLFKELPQYITFVELVETSKIYMKGVSSFEEQWIPIYLANQCAFEKPEEEPSPRFDSQKDSIVCYRKSKFGRLMWQINEVEVEYPESLEKYKWFARFLLEGQVNDSFKKYSNVLLASPTTMLKSWAKLQPRTEALLNALVSRNCDSKEKLSKIWAENKYYLCNEYLMWIPESLHYDIRFKWPHLT